MRHIPTALYIDTQVFMAQGLRLDTKDLRRLKDTFVKGGIRLLVPAMMESELLRHYREQAEKSANAVEKTQNMHPMPFLEMWSPRPKNEVIEACFNRLKSDWEHFKSHFTVESLPLVGDLDRVVDWYFEVKPPFSDKKPKEFPDAFILSALDLYHNDHNANIAVVSRDDGFSEACQRRRYTEHFETLEEYINAFQPELTKEKYKIPEPVDPTQPAVTEDLTELKSIMNRGIDATELERERVLQLVQGRGDSYRYFFSQAKDPMWIPYLKARGLFDRPPDVQRTEDGVLKIAVWPPVHYLERVFESPPNREEILCLLEELPETANPYVLESIVNIVLKSDDANNLVRLSEKILAFVDHFRWNPRKVINLIDMLSLAGGRLGGFSESFLLKVVEFQPDPLAGEKQERRSTEQEAWSTLLKPSPRFDESDYKRILGEGVQRLSEREPYQTARILIDATATMIRLTFHQDELEEAGSKDRSTIWCRDLNDASGPYRDSRVNLVLALTFACERVYEKAPESVSALDQALRNQHWDVFTRICQHLYALHLTEQTKPWIRDMILAHEEYDRWHHGFEFQRMIQLACKTFGADLLTRAQKEVIFEAILAGPSEQDFRKFVGDAFTEESFETRKRYFHLLQLRPFAPVLFGQYADYFQELEASQEQPVTDHDYAPYRFEGGRFIEDQSPITTDELARMSDEEFLSFLNNWETGMATLGDWWAKISFEGLAKAFQAFFDEAILTNDARLNFWIDNRGRIERPIYVRAMVSSIHARVKAKQFDRLDQWFDFCEWVLSHDEQPTEEGVNRSDESREHPDWHSSRRAVGDFVKTCLGKDTNVPIWARDRIAALLDRLCTQFDRRLDEDEPVLLSRDDQLTEAINNTRSRSLEGLVDFGYWVRRQIQNDKAATPEVFDILEKRIGSGHQRPLTLPEYALLGLHFIRIWGLNNECTARHKKDFFPQENLLAWQEAFGNFLNYTRPYKPTFDLVRDDIEFALENVDHFKTHGHEPRNLTDTLGEHLFTYYLWEVYPLTGDESLLDRFYEKTEQQRDRWSSLFNFIGWSLKNTDTQLEEGLKQRIIEFFNWRLEEKEPRELKEFTFWLEAKCLDAEWRLRSFSQVLDISQPEDIGLYDQIHTLRGLLNDYTALVVECFAKLTEAVIKSKSAPYIDTDEAQPILQAGLKSNDEVVRAHAERARENLLKCGLYGFLDDEN